MTKEQAIQTIKDLIQNGFTNFGGKEPLSAEETDALKMAIKALEQQPYDDCVSRQAVDQNIYDYAESNGLSYANLKNAILDVPSVTPTHGICKDCSHCYMDEDGHGYHCEKFDYTRFPVYADFYCADFEKRGDLDGSN